MTLIEDVKGFKKDIKKYWKHNNVSLNFNSGKWIKLVIKADHDKEKQNLYFKNLVRFYNWLYDKWNLYIEEVRCSDWGSNDSKLILYIKDAK